MTWFLKLSTSLQIITKSDVDLSMNSCADTVSRACQVRKG